MYLPDLIFALKNAGIWELGVAKYAHLDMAC